jgi:hypothetical protein
MKTLKQLIKRFLPSFLKIRIIRWSAKYRLQKRKTLHLDVHLVDHCNLNCKGCDNYSSISQEKYHSVESLERDFSRIHQLFKGKIDGILLLGGEPLLHPDVCKILDLAGKYFMDTNVKLVTNGILLLKQNADFWESCRRNNIKISVTKYPVRLNHQAMAQKAQECGVAFEFYGGSDAVVKDLWKVPLNLRGTENPKRSFRYCSRSNKCIALYEGKLFTCTGIPYIEHFNRYFGTDIQVSDKDYIDIHKARSADEIFEFLRKPMPFCRYCNTKGTKWGIKWDVSKKEISEWT